MKRLIFVSKCNEIINIDKCNSISQLSFVEMNLEGIKRKERMKKDEDGRVIL